MLLAGDGRSASSHADPIAPVILGVTGILFIALLGRFTARRLGQPTVLGELLVGVIVGNVGYYFGNDFMEILRQGPAVFDTIDLALHGDTLDHAAEVTMGPEESKIVLEALHGPNGWSLTQVAHTVDVFSRYGVIFMLFLIGLETSVDEMRKVGSGSFSVAIVGVAAPFVLGFGAAWLLMPGHDLNVAMFVAATLGATSIGITARVLGELGLIQSKEARIVLGAAVIDDILGLLMLAIVSGIIITGEFNIFEAGKIIALAALFLATAFFLGPHFLKANIFLFRKLDIVEAKMFVSYLFVMVLAWFANLVGLAAIVGAFAAGVILHDAYFKHWGEVRAHSFTIRDLIMPLEVIMVPIFFVLMGIQVKLESFANVDVLMISTGLIVAAIIGKLLSGYVAGRKLNNLAVGVGMMPRGEVGLVFASIGKSLGVINDELFSAIVLMVIVTTLIAPAALKFTLEFGGAHFDDLQNKIDKSRAKL
jgi:Kef-type K+ transport system membrane component KefB